MSLRNAIPYLDREGRVPFIGSQERIMYWVVILTFLVLIVYPLGYLFLGSFSANAPTEPFQFTIANYIDLFTRQDMLVAMQHTLFVAIGTTILSMLIGTGLAWIVVRTKTPYVQRLQWLLVIPFFLSPLLGGLAWQGLAGPNIGLFNGLLEMVFGFRPLDVITKWGMIWVMSLYYTPFVYLMVAGTLSNMDASLEEVATISGASQLSTVRRITLPLMLPSILSSSLLVFVLAASQFSIPSIYGLRKGYFVLATRIWQSLQITPVEYGAATAAAVVLTLLTAALVLFRSFVIQDREYTTVLGKSTRPKKMDLGRWHYLLLGFVITYVLFAVFLPFGYFTLLSFYKFLVPVPNPDVLTLDQWRTVLGYSTFFTAIRNSIFLGIFGSIIAITLGALISWITVRTDVRGRKLIDAFGTIPIAVPSLVMGVAYLWATLKLGIGLYGTIWVLLLVYVARFFPYAVRSIDSNLRQISNDMEEVGYISGASWFTSFRQITLPLLKPGIVASFVLLYVTYVRELAMSIMLYSSDSVVLSVMIFDLWYDGNIAQVAVIGTVQIVIILVGLVVFVRVFDVDLVETAQR